MQVTATEAKNRFGAICASAKTEPVFVQKDGRIDTVIMSAQQFDALLAADVNRDQKKKQFESDYKYWIDEQNARFERHGLWCDDMRTW
ncbi:MULTISPECIES: type II toxin-antitoxin system Phd/YefM family antitoxin [Polynucleobacter]|uniref:Prevent-host-death protein n=2 Tax=Polynucleobacter TaxID=44013 RepID=A0A6M9PR07_9BURK|nr:MULTISPECIES: type II toxin-antitoxin system Phd/YefM family antitoxin [Polynucleobacter]PJI76129.1 post-segregation antitoxin CcdA [Polynucleobacter brandtiae]QKM61928.1 prevent-host-death protein [Polynucleobacter antarcticus]